MQYIFFYFSLSMVFTLCERVCLLCSSVTIIHKIHYVLAFMGSSSSQSGCDERQKKLLKMECIFHLNAHLLALCLHTPFLSFVIQFCSFFLPKKLSSFATPSFSCFYSLIRWYVFLKISSYSFGSLFFSVMCLECAEKLLFNAMVFQICHNLVSAQQIHIGATAQQAIHRI